MDEVGVVQLVVVLERAEVVIAEVLQQRQVRDSEQQLEHAHLLEANERALPQFGHR